MSFSILDGVEQGVDGVSDGIVGCLALVLDDFVPSEPLAPVLAEVDWKCSLVFDIGGNVTCLRTHFLW